MIEVIYLRNDEVRPTSDRVLLIECIAGKCGKAMQASPQGGVTMTIGPEALPATIAELEEKGEEKVYVRLPER